MHYGHLFFWLIVFGTFVAWLVGITRPDAVRVHYVYGILLWVAIAILGYLTIGFKL